ncbi:hypothetical protein [Sphingomonas sp. CCH15-F11]|uniref:hypothetical protein n=1 Tax=Sphingomonas sp. CCH15-F11 TaxID=1768785 RepID=UPI0008341C9D|nr:hypothetical protein [Sphingomonas sp. CCH15-F11]
MTTFRIVAGQGMAEGRAVLPLTLRVRDLAVSLGFRAGGVKSSHCPGSSSRYLTLTCPRGHDWLVRISNHRRPERTRQPAPHIDFVSLDGQAGTLQLADLLTRIGDGQVDWRPLKAGGRR